MSDVYFEDVVIGAELRSESHVVSAEDIGRFCDLTHDHHPLHTDADYAQSRGFPGVIAHGLFGLSLMEGLKTALKIYENSSIASLGWDQVRFLRPVVAGDAVRVVFRIHRQTYCRRAVGRGVVTETPAARQPARRSP